MNEAQPVAPDDEDLDARKAEAPAIVDSAGPEPTVRIIDNFAKLTDRERRAWKRLEEQPSICEPFQTLFYNEKWWEQFGRARGSSARILQIFIVETGSEVIGIFPMLRQKIAVKGVPVISYLQPLGADNILTELRTGLVREGQAHAAYSAFISYLQTRYHHWEVISLPAGPAEVAELYGKVSVPHPTRPLVESFCVPLEPDLASFRSKMKRNIKESIRKCYNSAKRDNVELVFRCLRDPEAIRASLPEFYRLHKLRAEQTHGNHHRNVFGEEYARQFIDALAGDPETSGLRLFLMEHQDRIVAARLGFETRHAMYLYYSGYEAEFGKYSVATTLVYEVIKHSIEAGKDTLNLSVGRDVSKTRWSPHENRYDWNLMFRPTMRGLAAKYAITSMMRLEYAGYLPALRLS